MAVQNEGTSELVIITIGNSTTEQFDTIGMTALGMLQKNHKVEFTFSGIIKCVDGVCASSGYWWPLYVNGNKASEGPHSYIVKNNDKIEFVLSKK